MRYNGMALFLLAGTVALTGCGGSATPSAADPSGMSNNAAPVVSAPSAEQPNKAQPEVKPAPGPKAPPAQVVTTPTAPAAGSGGASQSGSATSGSSSGASGASTSATSGGSSSGGSSSGSASGGGGGGGSAGGGDATVDGGDGAEGAGPGPVAGPPAGGLGWGGHDFIVFASNRYPNEGNMDIFVFDPLQDTVLAVVGVNTYANEFNPRISDNGKWLVFQRTVGVGGHCRWVGYGNQDILLYSMDSKLVNTLHNLNTELADEYMPDVTDDGCKIVYVSDEGGYASLRLYDVKTGDNWIVPGANRNFPDITWPTISANGLKIAYGASSGFGHGVATDGTGLPTGGPAITGNALWPGESNIYVYDVAHGVQLTPPFVNTAFDEYNPELCWDGSRMLFVSNRLGTQDIFEVNFDNGMTDNLSFLNSAGLDEQQPRYLGGTIDRIVYQVKYPYSVGPVSLRAYNRTAGVVDTLPVANHLFADSALRAPQPEVADVGP